MENNAITLHDHKNSCQQQNFSSKIFENYKNYVFITILINVQLPILVQRTLSFEPKRSACSRTSVVVPEKKGIVFKTPASTKIGKPEGVAQVLILI